METRQPPRYYPAVSLLVYALGALLGLVFLGAATWADIEGALFNPTLPADKTLSSIKCPLFINYSEVGEVKVTLGNPTDKVLRRAVRVHISAGFVTLFREARSQVVIEPGEKQQLSWPITAYDAAWERFVLARVYLHSNYPLPSEHASCGVLVVDLFNLPSSLVVVLAVAGSLLGMGIGLRLWSSLRKPLRGRRRQAAFAMGGVAAMLLAGVLASLAGSWPAGGFFLLVSVLLIAVVVAYFIQTSGK